jgi:hypothetical protein
MIPILWAQAWHAFWQTGAKISNEHEVLIDLLDKRIANLRSSRSCLKQILQN